MDLIDISAVSEQEKLKRAKRSRELEKKRSEYERKYHRAKMLQAFSKKMIPYETILGALCGCSLATLAAVSQILRYNVTTTLSTPIAIVGCLLAGIITGAVIGNLVRAQALEFVEYFKERAELIRKTKEML